MLVLLKSMLRVTHVKQKYAGGFDLLGCIHCDVLAKGVSNIGSGLRTYATGTSCR